MEGYNQPFDVCIVCALYEEAEAVLNEFSTRCQVSFSKAFSNMDRYAYQHTTIRNKHEELLTVLLTWLSDSGPSQTGLDLKPFLHEFRPRFVAMTGICAGYRKKIKLGDLVVAQYAYHYEEGKIIREPGGSSRHLLEMKTADPASQIVQYARGFDGWKDPVREMKRHKLKRQLRGNEEPRCVVAPMASGMAVRGDDPFPWLREKYNRNTIALDMEAATFYRALRAVPHISALVVKGVCDYADMSKNDTYHNYAARVSAVYLLSFIQEYVTEQTMPRRDPSSDWAGPPIWTVPFQRHPFFTGQEPVLVQLADTLKTGQPTALSQPQAISGLGGIGKTQIAVEYAYRHARDYQAILWVRADTLESLVSGYVALARRLDLPQKDEYDQTIIVQAMEQWLKTHREWLLIFDNADDFSIVSMFLRSPLGGHILLTTRAHAVGPLAQRVNVETMSMEVGALFLLRRAGLLELHASLDAVSPSERTTASAITEELDGLPLALDQAGAYIEETGCSLAGYLRVYQQRQMELLGRRGSFSSDYPSSVATTWTLSFQRIKQQNPAAADLLRCCALLHPDAIPEELFTNGSRHLGSRLQRAASDFLTFDEAVRVLLTYSLIHRDPGTATFSIHRLVQAVLLDIMSERQQSRWQERVVRAVNEVFPESVLLEWTRCGRLLPHVLVCVPWIEREPIPILEASHLLDKAGTYLQERGQFRDAEPLLIRALAIREQQLGAEHSDTAKSLNSLAMLYYDLTKYEQVEPLAVRALAICEQQLGAEHPETARSLQALAAVYRTQGKHKQAEPLFERALAIYEQQLGPLHPHTARCLYGLALTYGLQGKYEQAEELHRRVVSIFEQQLGTENRNTAFGLYHLAELYRAQGKYEQAKPLVEQALVICEQLLGMEHLATAACLSGLARVYLAQEKYKEAKPLLERASAIAEQHPEAAEYPEMVYGLHGLAKLSQHEGKYKQAEALYQRALALLERRRGMIFPTTQRDIEKDYATFLRLVGRDAEATVLDTSHEPPAESSH